MENIYLKKKIGKNKEYVCNEFKRIYININMIKKCVWWFVLKNQNIMISAFDYIY